MDCFYTAAPVGIFIFMAEIPKGFYIKARKIQDSQIAHAPPHIREIWDWMLRNANHKPQKVNGVIIGRGQLFATYAKIIEDLHWMIGYKRVTYKKHHCEIAMKHLVKATMITTTKTTRGMLITICNYDYYNDISNYECYNKSYTKATMKLQWNDTINKNEKNITNTNTLIVKQNEKNEKEISESNRNNPSWELTYAKGK